MNINPQDFLDNSEDLEELAVVQAIPRSNKRPLVDREFEDKQRTKVRDSARKYKRSIN